MKYAGDEWKGRGNISSETKAMKYGNSKTKK